jgi:PAS domain-containing protein
MNYYGQDNTDAQELRARAEKDIKENQLKIAQTDLESDTKKLLHELQVYQVELKMQNEELQIANEAAEAALKKYTMLYDFAPMGYFTLDQDGSICELNFTGAELLGDKRVALINSNFKLFVAIESRHAFNDFLDRVYSGSAKESCHVKLGYDNTPLGRVYMEGIVTGDDRNCLLSVVNISDINLNTP